VEIKRSISRLKSKLRRQERRIRASMKKSRRSLFHSTIKESSLCSFTTLDRRKLSFRVLSRKRKLIKKATNIKMEDHNGSLNSTLMNDSFLG
jgi:hypothetical protein